MRFRPYDMLEDAERALVNSARVSERMQAALQGFAPEMLIDDADRSVRSALGSTGYPMLLCARSGDISVRKVCAEAGYALDALTEDKDLDVRAAAWKAVGEAGITLSEWIARNPERCLYVHDEIPDAGASQERKPCIEEVTHEACSRAKERNASRRGRKQIKAIAQRTR